MESVVVENIGAVPLVEIPIPDGGGVVVLRGRNGIGKSTALSAVSALLGGESRLEKRDGTIAGQVSGFGAKISVKKSARHSGVAEVESIEARLNPHELVNPSIADPVKADARRIKALCQLAQITPDADAFRVLFASEADYKLAMDELDRSGDIVEIAVRLKRQLEATARDVERRASETAGKAAGYRQSAEAGRVEFEPGDPATLQRELEEAIRRETRLKADRANAEKILQAAKTAHQQLERVKATYTGPTIEVATATAAEARKRITETADALAAAKAAHEAAVAESRQADFAKDRACEHDHAIATWQESVDTAAKVTLPSEEDISTAGLDVQTAHERIKRAAASKKSVADFKLARTYDEEANRLRERAEQWRSTARRTEEVLSKAVGTLNSPFKVIDGRLVLETDRGDELFADLSDGERWRVVIDTLAPFCPRDGVMVIPQSAWGELSPHNRREIDQVFRDRGVTCITAEATDGDELAAEVWNQ